MGRLIQCSGIIAKKPYYFKLTDTNVYTIEEVCYYIRHNIYMIQEELFEESFAEWLCEELGMDETAKKIEDMIEDHNNLKDIVVTLCCSCDYYTEKEINELIAIMDETENLPLRGRAKIKADNYLRCGFYEKAIEEYDHILNCDDMLNANISEYGEMYHNMGVAYAMLEDFGNAAVSFKSAYEKNSSDESLKQYIYALKLTGDKELYSKEAKKLDIDIQKITCIEKDYKSACDEAEKSKNIKNIERLKETMKSGYVEEYYDNINSYINGWKEEYRKEISR